MKKNYGNNINELILSSFQIDSLTSEEIRMQNTNNEVIENTLFKAPNKTIEETEKLEEQKKLIKQALSKEAEQNVSRFKNYTHQPDKSVPDSIHIREAKIRTESFVNQTVDPYSRPLY